MEVRAGGPAGGTHIADDLTLSDVGPGGHRHGGHMSIERGVAAAVVDEDIVAVGIIRVGSGHSTGRRSIDGGTGAGADINAGVELIGSGDRMVTITVGTGDGTNGSRPDKLSGSGRFRSRSSGITAAGFCGSGAFDPAVYSGSGRIWLNSSAVCGVYSVPPSPLCSASEIPSGAD